MAEDLIKEIDFEKLRKTLVTRQAINAMFIDTHSATSTTTNIYDATPEQLINYARRAGINLDKFKLNK